MIDLIAERAGKQARTILDQIQTSPEEILTVKLLTVCKGDKDLSDQLLPYLNCIELDGWGYPLVHPKGVFVVGLGQDRRASGSHYTPKALTEKVVEGTLIPIVYEGPSRRRKSQLEVKAATQNTGFESMRPCYGISSIFGSDVSLVG